MSAAIEKFDFRKFDFKKFDYKKFDTTLSSFPDLVTLELFSSMQNGDDGIDDIFCGQD